MSRPQPSARFIPGSLIAHATPRRVAALGVLGLSAALGLRTVQSRAAESAPLTQPSNVPAAAPTTPAAPVMTTPAPPVMTTPVLTTPVAVTPVPATSPSITPATAPAADTARIDAGPATAQAAAPATGPSIAGPLTTGPYAMGTTRPEGQPAATAPTTASAVATTASAVATATGPTTSPETGPVSRRDDWTDRRSTVAAAPGSGSGRQSRDNPPPPGPAPAGVKPLAPKFQNLAVRSIFSRERIRFSSGDPTTREMTPAEILAAQAAALAASTQPVTLESNLSLKGLAIEDGQPVAFVEDAAAARTLRLTPGTSVARGRVAAVSLHDLDYEVAGKISRIQIGQNFEGGAPLAPSAMIVSPSTPGATPPAASGGNSSVLEAMRRKRLEGK